MVPVAELFTMAEKICQEDGCINFFAGPPIDDLAELGRNDPMYAEFAKIVKNNGGMWCAEAENYLLAHAPRL